MVARLTRLPYDGAHTARRRVSRPTWLAALGFEAGAERRGVHSRTLPCAPEWTCLQMPTGYGWFIGGGTKPGRNPRAAENASWVGFSPVRTQESIANTAPSNCGPVNAQCPLPFV